MKKLATDVVILGGGTAGLGAYRAAKLQTNKVILVEDHQFGTTCARVGCMPSKLLIAAADAAHSAKHTTPFGVEVAGEIIINGQAVMRRVKNERDRFVSFVMEDVEKIAAADKVLGKASFVDAHTIMVDRHTQIKAKRIVIATGSRPNILESWLALGDKLIINDDIFGWDDLPDSVAIFGPGVIGLEIGQALHRLGVKIWIFGTSQSVGPLTDPVILAEATHIFQQELRLMLETKHTEINQEGDKVKISFINQYGNQETIYVDYLLAATGRRPNVDNIGLENIHLTQDQHGVPIANPATMQTSLAHIFIAGDSSNQLPLLHEAADQGKIAGENAGRFPDLQDGLRRSTLSIVFSDPQISIVGERYRTLNAKYPDCNCLVVGEASFSNQGRSRVMLKNKGMLHVYAEQGSGLFLGAEMIGPAAEHIAHLLAWAHQQKMTIKQMLDMPFYHPVIEEGLRTALRNAQAKLQIDYEFNKNCQHDRQD